MYEVCGVCEVCSRKPSGSPPGVGWLPRQLLAERVQIRREGHIEELDTEVAPELLLHDVSMRHDRRRRLQPLPTPDSLEEDPQVPVANPVAQKEEVALPQLVQELKGNEALDRALNRLSESRPDHASMDAALEGALVKLLSTPVPDDPIEVRASGGVYAYANPQLEQLSSAQKLLIRTGPANARKIQARLREIALALGIPASRLPGT